MAYPQLVILGYSEAAMFMRQSPPPKIGAIISIHGCREFGVEASCPHRLDLLFNDVDVPAENDIIALQRHISRQHSSAQNGLIEVAPTSSDAASIIEFANTIRDVDGSLLCHCNGGMSRAPAAALICLSVWRGPNTETNCVAEIQRFRHGAVPHTGLIRFADNLLNRNNRLINALSAVRKCPSSNRKSQI